MTDVLNLTRQIERSKREFNKNGDVLNGTRLVKRDSAAQKPTGFAGSPHGVRSREFYEISPSTAALK